MSIISKIAENTIAPECFIIEYEVSTPFRRNLYWQIAREGLIRMKRVNVTIIVVLVFCISSFCITKLNAEWFEQETLRSILLFEKLTDKGYRPHGTGFLVGARSDTSIYRYDMRIAITNKHLLHGREEVYVSIPATDEFIKYTKSAGTKQVKVKSRMWSLDGKRLRTKFETIINDKKMYAVHDNPAIDIAAFQLNPPGIITTDDGKEVKVSNIALLGDSFVGSNKEIRLGRETYFVGFPWGFGSLDPISPVVRSASVAWIDPCHGEYWLDAISLGGNSGSPVFTKTQKLQDDELEHAKLVGIIFGHHGDKRQLISIDTSCQAHIELLEIENSQLARAVFINDILIVIDKAKKL